MCSALPLGGLFCLYTQRWMQKALDCTLGLCSVPSHFRALVARKLASCFTHLWSLLHWVSVSCQIQCIQFGFPAPLFCQTSLLIMLSKLPSAWIPFSLSALHLWRPLICSFTVWTRHPVAGRLDQVLFTISSLADSLFCILIKLYVVGLARLLHFMEKLSVLCQLS